MGLIMAEARFCAKSDLLQGLCSFCHGILLLKCHSTPLARPHESEGRRKGAEFQGASRGKEGWGNRPCWAALEQISRLADSGGKGSDALVIRDLGEQGPQRNQPVSGLTKKRGGGKQRRS